MATPAADWCNIGVGAGKNNYQLDYSTATGAGITTATPSTLAASTGISNIMYANASNTAMMLRSDVDVDVIASNGYPRSELRERQQDGSTLRAFNPTTGDHSASTWVCPTHLPPVKPSFVMLQCHDAVQDLMEVAIQPRSDFATTGKLEVVLRIARTDHSGGSSAGIPRFIADFQWGTWLNPRIRMGAIAPGSVAGWSASCNGVVINSWDPGMPAVDTVNGSNAYFKSGVYLQTKWTGSGTGGLETDRNEYGESAFRDFITSHNGETATSVQVRGTRVEDIASAVTWGAGTSGHQTVANAGITLTPALPTGLVAGDVMYCIVRASRGINDTVTVGTASVPSPNTAPSSPTLSTGWDKVIGTKSPHNNVVGSELGAYPSGPQLAAHTIRWQLWAKQWVSGDVAPTVTYAGGGTKTDTMTAQIFKASGTKADTDTRTVIDQPPNGLDMNNPADNNNTITGITYAAATSTTVVGPTAALAANCQPGALAIACVYHETNATNTTVGVVTGGADGLTWAEGGQLSVITVTPASGSGAEADEPAWAHDWAIVPASAGQAIPAKQAAGTISNDCNKPNTSSTLAGVGWGLLFTLAAARKHRPRLRRAT